MKPTFPENITTSVRRGTPQRYLFYSGKGSLNTSNRSFSVRLNLGIAWDLKSHSRWAVTHHPLSPPDCRAWRKDEGRYSDETLWVKTLKLGCWKHLEVCGTYLGIKLFASSASSGQSEASWANSKGFSVWSLLRILHGIKFWGVSRQVEASKFASRCGCH